MNNPSPAQIQYLNRKKREKQFIFTARLFLFLFFLYIWEYASQKGFIDSFIFSSPTQIFSCFFYMWKEEALFTHILITLKETLFSFLYVVFIGTGIAVLMWRLPTLSKICEPYLVILNSLPKSALAPLLIVWLGATQKTIIVSGMSVAIFGSIIHLYAGFQEVDPEKRKLIRTLGGGKKDELFKIVLPSSIPLILSIMKVNIGLCLVGVIIGEFIGAKQGLGYLIIYGSQTFKLDWMLTSIAILFIIAMALYGILSFLEKRYQKQI